VPDDESQIESSVPLGPDLWMDGRWAEDSKRSRGKGAAILAFVLAGFSLLSSGGGALYVAYFEPMLIENLDGEMGYFEDRQYPDNGTSDEQNEWNQTQEAVKELNATLQLMTDDRYHGLMNSQLIFGAVSGLLLGAAGALILTGQRHGFPFAIGVYALNLFFGLYYTYLWGIFLDEVYQTGDLIMGVSLILGGSMSMLFSLACIGFTGYSWWLIHSDNKGKNSFNT